MSTHALLSRGYFPRELPPPFTTISFANFIRNHSGTLPTSFTAGRQSAQLIRHDLPRVNLKRRILGIPNPVLHYNLCEAVFNNWAAINAHCAKSEFSCSSPTFNRQSTGQAIVAAHTFDELQAKRVSVRSFARYILRTDISKFYGSIYTHSIPWALHSKKTAKSNRRNSSLLGNILDKWIRIGQDDQTVGVPIGPDTSLMISEIILTAFDEIVKNQLPRLRGFRYIDDMEFGFETYREAQEALVPQLGEPAEPK